MKQIRINVSKVPDHVKTSLCRSALPGIRAFYENPENMRKFEEWQRQRQAQQKGAK